jgi:hypothetical protein
MRKEKRINTLTPCIVFCEIELSDTDDNPHRIQTGTNDIDGQNRVIYETKDVYCVSELAIQEFSMFEDVIKQAGTIRREVSIEDYLRLKGYK